MVLYKENISYEQDYHYVCDQIKWAPLYKLIQTQQTKSCDMDLTVLVIRLN